MRFSKMISISLALGFILGSAYSSAALDISSKEHSHSHKGYYKPGAAVTLSYDYDGNTQPGELESLTLTVSHYYSDGYLSARFLETPELEIISHQILDNKKLEQGSSAQLPIQLSGHKDGEYYISVEITYESLSGDRSLRVLSLPIQIGHVDKSKTTTPAPKISKPSDKKDLVIFNAQEIIK